MALLEDGDRITEDWLQNPEVVTITIQQQINQDAWSNFTMQNSWTDVGVANGYSQAQYVRTKTREVIVSMLIQPGTGSQPVVALPAGYRPSVIRRLVVYNASTGVSTMATVSTGGVIDLIGTFSASNFVHVFGSFPLD